MSTFSKMKFQMFITNAFLIRLFLANSDIGINFTFVSGQSEKELLLELRNDLTYNSSLSTKLVNWNESTDFCHWPGVKCDVNGRVSSLDLSGESISGGINDAASPLFRLVKLQSLSLAQNSFDPVKLPSGLGKLTELRYLSLSNSGFSDQIPLDFSNLTRLVVLDLSYLSHTSLENPDLRSLIHNFTRLRELYLDWVNISANGNEWGRAISSSLPKLQVLSLSNTYLTGPFDSSLLKLRSLSVIHLDGNNFSSSFPEFFAEFPHLRELTLSLCYLSGVAPRKLFQIKSLETIDLSSNSDLEGSLPDEFPVNGSLQKPSLPSCNFSGPIPSSIKNLNQLVKLDLSFNRFSGSVPSFALLKNLREINLSFNKLTGEIPGSHWEGLENLLWLDLSENSLEGQVPASLFGLPSLYSLSLSKNSFSGIRVPTNISSPLEFLRMDVNNFEGPIPKFLFELQHLMTLSLSSNKFNGSLELTDFRKMTNLQELHLSYNNLSVHVNEELSVTTLFPRLESLRLASCKLRKFPLLKNLPLLDLDLSDNQLDGEIPNWLWEAHRVPLYILNLSHNRFSRIQEPFGPLSIQNLDLHSDMLGGQIPDLSTSPVSMDFSSNNFSSLPPNIGNYLRGAMFFSVADNKIAGTIPPSLCHASSLEVLDLSNNSFHGRIPSCLFENTLNVLNLRRNKLDGDIPDTSPVGCRLQRLDLSFNVLQGKVPNSLTRCTEIQVLNLGTNHLNGTLPCWLNNLSKLRVLVLRFNKFPGNIDCLLESNTWPNLQIIDFASNNINGVIPANMFRKLQALMVDEDGAHHQRDHLHFAVLNGVYYQDSVTVTLKGNVVELKKILTIFTSIDFSENQLQGVIPQTIGELRSLYALNFSHNALSGHIPSSIGNLKKLGSLDLSFNKLDGEIPMQLASITTFSVLNLSYNNLVGRIPQGNQIQTYPDGFIGNDGLCGFPLDKICNDVGTPPALKREQEETSAREMYISAALGFVVGLGVVVGPLVFCKRWRRCYNKYVDRIILLILCRKDRKQRNKNW